MLSRYVCLPLLFFLTIRSQAQPEGYLIGFQNIPNLQGALNQQPGAKMCLFNLVKNQDPFCYGVMQLFIGANKEGSADDLCRLQNLEQQYIAGNSLQVEAERDSSNNPKCVKAENKKKKSKKKNSELFESDSVGKLVDSKVKTFDEVIEFNKDSLFTNDKSGKKFWGTLPVTFNESDLDQLITGSSKVYKDNETDEYFWGDKKDDGEFYRRLSGETSD